MASRLLSIASSGLAASSAALNVTAQNISNASTAGYVRESVNQSELNTPENTGVTNAMALSGVRVTGINRDVSTYLQGQVYTTGSAAAAADGNVTNLTNVGNAVEQSNVYSSITAFQAGLETLGANPTNASLRASVLADANNMAQSLNLASNSLTTAQSGMQTDATGGVSSVNQLASNLAQINQQIAIDPDPANNGAGLLDQRDAALTALSKLTNFNATYAANGTVAVQMGGNSGPNLVSGGTATTLAATTAANGTISFTLGGTALTVTGGSLAADQNGLASAAGAVTSLNAIASSLITTVNTAQAGGADLTGAAGAAMFSGTTAANIAVTMTSAGQIATAAAGSAAGSQDITNLNAMQSALTTAGVAANTNSLIFNLSSATASATTSQTATDAIAGQAKAQLAAQSGVDLNTEAANLLQYQQAFQASGKVIQVASTLFNQLLGIQ